MSGPRSRDGSSSNSNPSPSSPVADVFGVDADDSRYTTATFLSALVPTAIGRRAIAVSVETDRDVYELDDPVEITVEFRNRLPVPVEVPTPRQRLWGWTIDDELEASDERRYTRSRPSSFSFSGGERKRASVTWNGRFRRSRADHTESVLPEPGEYEIHAFVATHEDAFEPSDSTTITIRR
ncbi:hypothetical protein [Natronobacterium texcoconense]|uniref:DUF7974 domain-containing protein n=1 Tax=Natronobacterium texcoconense TaxID=1095778 RepID=A0A1H1HSJ1_NATTX|nr:hypothetical protein [Natronobacterium texcoconense]SDR28357.1 hypothetical protein SAMN04489842_3008 [Natronobacterium texcoconense]